jgi:hypothetical protein
MNITTLLDQSITLVNFIPGWRVLHGKFVEGHAPPKKIALCSSEVFSASGREGSTYSPKGEVFYVNREMDLKVTKKYEF